MVPRFGVAQGLKPDGTAKIRAVDHFSWSCAAGRKKRKRTEVKEVRSAAQHPIGLAVPACRPV